MQYCMYDAHSAGHIGAHDSSLDERDAIVPQVFLVRLKHVRHYYQYALDPVQHQITEGRLGLLSIPKIHKQ